MPSTLDSHLTLESSKDLLFEVLCQSMVVHHDYHPVRTIVCILMEYKTLVHLYDSCEENWIQLYEDFEWPKLFWDISRFSSKKSKDNT